MPSSIDIMSPSNLNLKANQFTSWLNDLLSKLHEISVLSQQVGKQNKIMLQSMNALFRNAILICVDEGIKDPDLMARKIGVSVKDLGPIFEAMIKEKKLKKEGKGYLRA